MNRLKGENWLENEHIFRMDSSKLLKLELTRIDDSCKRGTKYPIDRQCGGSIADCARWTPDQRHWCHVSLLLLARKIKSFRIDYEYARLPLDSLLAHPISLAITYLRHNLVAVQPQLQRDF